MSSPQRINGLFISFPALSDGGFSVEVLRARLRSQLTRVSRMHTLFFPQITFGQAVRRLTRDRSKISAWRFIRTSGMCREVLATAKGYGSTLYNGFLVGEGALPSQARVLWAEGKFESVKWSRIVFLSNSGGSGIWMTTNVYLILGYMSVKDSMSMSLVNAFLNERIKDCLKKSKREKCLCFNRMFGFHENLKDFL